MVNIITPNSPATFNQRVAMSTLNSNDSVSPQSPNLQLPVSETPKKTKTNQSKTFIAILGLVAFIGLASLAVLISSRQRSSPGPVAPNAPESKPQAYIEKPKTCSLTFEIPVACNSICLQTSDCASINPAWDCLAHTAPASVPNPTIVAMMCGGIIGDICPSGYSCTAPPTAGASGHCIINAFVDTNQKRCRLVANPASETCSPPNSPTPTITPVISLTPSVTPSVTPVISLTPSPTLPGPTPSNTPVPTIPPGITVNPTTPGLPPTYKVVTTLNCNGSCSKNSDCSNISHICYNGKCRLDANPESTRCVLVTGETSVVINVIPTRTPVPAELTKTGPADWANYLKVGFGALGVGALLLLFL